MFQQEAFLHHKNIYACLSNLWTRAATNGTPSLSLSLGKYRLDKAFLAVELIGYVADHKYVNTLGERLGIQIRKVKTSGIFDIVSTFWNIWLLSQDAKKVTALSYIQRVWRLEKAALMGPWPKVAAVNDTDSFTMEKLQNIYNISDRLSVFSYSDSKGNVYAFCGRSLYEHIFIYKNAFNPFTRENIPSVDIKRLHELWCACHKPSNIIGHAIGHAFRSTPRYVVAQTTATQHFTNPSIAFTEVVSVLESRFNIYCQPQWLLSLNEIDIMGIFSRFHSTVRSSNYMNRQAEENAFDDNPPTSSQLVLASEMLNLLSRESPLSTIVCILIEVIAHFSIHLQASLPEWVYDAAQESL